MSIKSFRTRIVPLLALALMVTTVVSAQEPPPPVGQDSPVPTGADDPRGSDRFEDVPVGHWADEAVGWAVENGVMTGTGEGMFHLDGLVTRAEMVTFLSRINTLLEGPANLGGVLGSDRFKDVPAWHEANAHIGWAVNHGVTVGVTEGVFDPLGLITRAQMVLPVPLESPRGGSHHR